MNKGYLDIEVTKSHTETVDGREVTYIDECELLSMSLPDVICDPGAGNRMYLIPSDAVIVRAENGEIKLMRRTGRELVPLNPKSCGVVELGKDGPNA
jgi:hypothetical protein